MTSLAKKFFIACDKPFWAGVLAFLYYTLIAVYAREWGTTSLFNYYSYLADAFAHGQLHLRLQPQITHDLSLFNGNLYLYWGPFPALVIIPLVLLFGVYFSDITLTMVISSLNVALVALVLRKCNERGILNLSPVQRGLLVFTFGFGSAQVTQSTYGTVWGVSLLMGLTFVALTYISVLSTHGGKAFFLAGLAISAALATRNTLVLAGIWPAYYLLRQHWSESWKKRFVYASLGAAPVFLTLGLLALYNYLRFGSITDVGLAYHNMWSVFVEDYQNYGTFNLHYVPRNLFYQWVAYPLLTRDRFEMVMGGSLLLLTPVFFAAFWAGKVKNLRPHTLVLVLTIIFSYLPIAFLMGTGLVQFGPRYLLDFMVPLLIITGIGIQYWPNRVTGILAAISFFQYMAGAILMSWFA